MKKYIIISIILVLIDMILIILMHFDGNAKEIVKEVNVSTLACSKKNDKHNFTDYIYFSDYGKIKYIKEDLIKNYNNYDDYNSNLIKLEEEASLKDYMNVIGNKDNLEIIIKYDKTVESYITLTMYLDANKMNLDGDCEIIDYQ